MKSFNLRILGACTNGSLQSIEMYKDLGSIIVGNSVSSEIVLYNNNDCNLDFKVYVKQRTEENLASKVLDDVCVLELETYKGHIQARSKFVIRCRIRPTRVIGYQFTVEYQIHYPNEKLENVVTLNDLNDLSSPRNQKEILCYLTANGVYPKLTITDIKALGPASNLSKDYLWKLLSINELNTCMNCEPNSDELVYSIATRQEANRRITNQLKRPMIDVNFNAAPLNSNETKVIMFVENTGYVPTDWFVLLVFFVLRFII